MRTKQIETVIEHINRIKNFKNDLINLVIEWETDINKMDFSKLKSQITCFDKILGIEMIDTPKINFFVDLAMIELVEFIKNASVKIIPPLWCKSIHIKDEITVKTEFNQMDGGHRIALANKLKIAKIPVILVERKNYIFTPDKWDFNLNENFLFVQKINENANYKFEIDKYYIEYDETEQGLNIFRNK